MNWKVPLASVDLSPDEIAAVEQVLRSGWLSMGPVTEEFEGAFARYLGVPHTLAATNGTAALHLACAAVGLGPGDEVLVPSLTFVATANAIMYTGATPVFVDIESEDDLTLSPVDCERKLTDRTKAIMVMHYGGYACDMAPILELAKARGLSVIEDAAHAPGACWGSRKCGTIGDVGCFSFFSNKNMTTGEGGLVATHSAELAERMRAMRSHGMTTLTWDRHRGHASSYDVVTPGYNYRIDEIRAALGLAQLAGLEERNRARGEHVRAYRKALGDVPGLGLPFSSHSRGLPSSHLMPVVLPEDTDRPALMASMREEGVQTSVHYPPVHLFTAYRALGHGEGELPHTELIAPRLLTLPLWDSITGAQRDAVLSALKAARAGTGHSPVERVAGDAG